MTHALPDPIAPGAVHQLTSLAVALAGAALVVLLLVGVLWAWRRRRGRASDQEQPRESWLAPRAGATPIRHLLGIILLLALLLPVTVAVRQLWPHPELGRRLVVIWLLVLLISSLTWLAARAGSRFRGRGS